MLALSLVGMLAGMLDALRVDQMEPLKAAQKVHLMADMSVVGMAASLAGQMVVR
jgi:hypothetical protein